MTERYSASGLQGSNFESCVWRAVSSLSSHHPQEVLLAQFSLYVHKSALKPDSFHLPTHRTHHRYQIRCLIFVYSLSHDFSVWSFKVETVINSFPLCFGSFWLHASWECCAVSTLLRPFIYCPLEMWIGAAILISTWTVMSRFLWYAIGVHLSTIWENTALVQWIKCEPLGEHLIHWTCAVFLPYRTKNEHRLYFLTRSSYTWHNCHRLQLKLQLKCDMGWYQYTSHGDNYCAECENKYIRGPPFNFQGGGGLEFFFEINNFWRTLREINNLLQELFFINIYVIKCEIFSTPPSATLVAFNVLLAD